MFWILELQNWASHTVTIDPEEEPNLQYTNFFASMLVIATAGSIVFSGHLPIHLSHSFEHIITGNASNLAQMCTWTEW